MPLTAILFIIGLAIIALMAIYSVYLFAQLRKQKRLFAQAQQARAIRLKESVEIIARAMQSGECNHSEGVIRLKMLLEPLGKSLSVYPAMWALFQVVQDMPTHDARKNLQKNERMKLDLAREAKEAELEQQIKTEAKQLLADLA